MASKKPSGAALLEGLGDATSKRPTGAEIAGRLTGALPSAPVVASAPVPAEARKRGRPSTGGAGMALTLRMDPALYTGLARHLPDLAVSGSTMPTVQDMLRAVGAAIVNDAELVRQLWAKGRDL